MNPSADLTLYLFATLGAHTLNGGWIAETAGEASYRGLPLASVGDVVHYADGSEAVIVDGAGAAAMYGDRPAALVGSRLSNGDVVTRTLQSEVGVCVSPEDPIPGLFDPTWVPSPARRRYRLAVSGSTTARGGVLARATGAWNLGVPLGPVAVVGDAVRYPDGSIARIATGLGMADAADFAPVAFVGSLLDNGDTITDSPERKGRASADTFKIVKPRRVNG